MIDPDAEAMPDFPHQVIVRVLVGIVLCILLAALDQTVVVPAVPTIARELNGFGHLSWIVSAYLLTSTATTPIYGKLSDIYGRRALLLPALVLFVLASALCALAGSLVQLILFRALQGAGGGGLMALAQAAIADVIAPRERGKYQAYMASMWAIASIAGPPVGGWVTDHLSWRWIFWVNLPIGLAAIVLSNRALKMVPQNRRRSRIDFAGAGLLTAGITSLLLALGLKGASYPWLSAPVMGLAAMGVASLAALVALEQRLADPLLPPRLFANDVFRRGVAVSFFTSLGLFAGIFLLPILFQLVRGSDPQRSGFEVMPFLAANVAGAYFAGQLARFSGRTKGLLLVGLGLCVAGFVLLAPAEHWPLAFLELLLMVLGFGVGMVMPTCLVIVQNAAERRDVGVATGTMLFLRSMGGAFGATLAGAILAGRFAASLAPLGLGKLFNLASLGEGGGTLANLTPSLQATLHEALSGAFSLAFLVTAGLLAVALVFAAGMADVPLRSGVMPEPLSH